MGKWTLFDEWYFNCEQLEKSQKTLKSLKSISFLNASDLAARTIPKNFTKQSKIGIKRRRIFYKTLLKALSEVHELQKTCMRDNQKNILAHLKQREAEYQFYILKIDRILKDFDFRKLQKSRDEQAPPEDMEYVQFTQNVKLTHQGRIHEPEADLYEQNGATKLTNFLGKMEEWSSKIQSLEMHDSIYEVPIRQKINLIYNQFGSTRAWKKLFKLKFDTNLEIQEDSLGKDQHGFVISKENTKKIGHIRDSSIEASLFNNEVSVFGKKNDEEYKDDGTFFTGVNLKASRKMKKVKRKNKKSKLGQKAIYENGGIHNGEDSFLQNGTGGYNSPTSPRSPRSPNYLGSDGGDNQDIYDKTIDLEEEQIFFSKQSLKLIDRTLLNKPLIDTLYQVAAHDGLENAQFELKDYLKMMQTFDGDNISNDSEIKSKAFNPRKLRAMFQLLKTNNVKKIEKLLERNTNPDCRRELIRHRFLNKDSEVDPQMKYSGKVKNHLRSEKKSYNKSSGYRALVKKHKTEMYQHR